MWMRLEVEPFGGIADWYQGFITLRYVAFPFSFGFITLPTFRFLI